MAKDPVCGMQVEESTALATANYKGKTFYFCTRSCIDAFVKEPRKYDEMLRTEEASC